MKALNVLLSILVSAVIGLLVFEGGLRLIGKGPKDTLVEFDAQTGWSKKKNYEFERSTPGYEVTIRTNEHGLNDDAGASPGKPEGVFRVLTLGDSFTQGFSVDRDHLFVDVLERWWVSEGRPIEIVNAGTEAFDTAQEVAWLEAYGAEYEPDLVLLFPYQNDLYWNSQLAYETPKGERLKPRYTPDGQRENTDLPKPDEETWIQRTATANLFGGSAGGDLAAHRFQVGGESIPSEFAPLFENEPAFMADVRSHTLGALRALHRTAASLGAEAFVVPIPDASLYAEVSSEGVNHSVTGMQLARVASPWDPNRPIDLVLELAGQASLATLDVRSYFNGRSDEGAELYFDPSYDWHLNHDGNAAFAEFLRGELDRLAAVPPTTSAVPMPPPPAGTDGIPFWVKLYVTLLIVLTVLYTGTYPELPKWKVPFQIAGMLGMVFAIFIGVMKLHRLMPPAFAPIFLILVVGGILSFVVYKLGRRVGTILELIKAFTLRGHWYLMPLVVVLLTIGSLLVVAASSPLIAPFIYTLF